MDDERSREVTSHQVLRAGALAHFKSEKRNPFAGSKAYQVPPNVPFVVVLTSKRVPVMVALEDLPQYLRQSITVVVFDARPVCVGLGRPKPTVERQGDKKA